MGVLKENLRIIRERIEFAASKTGRSEESIELMAVTKTRSYAEVLRAYENGIRLFGENRVQEAAFKYQNPPQGLKLNLIGHLQRNKAKSAAVVFQAVESIDKVETAQSLDDKCRELNKTMEILIEYNTSKEETQFGIRSKDDVFRCIEAVLELKSLKLRGLMTIAPFTQDKNQIRNAFCELREIFEECQKRLSLVYFDTLSMGMSSDFEIAIEEGSTRVRLGSSLFGKRDQ